MLHGRHHRDPASCVISYGKGNPHFAGDDTRPTCNKARNDFLAAAAGERRYGLVVSIPKARRNGAVHRIDAAVADLGIRLSRGKLTLIGNGLR